ncbi:HWE histidine kinase domain-containing protein [Komagataeibacter sp. FNDCF1]|uniref:HWE histidine kinase domain-containing protein n=1 Tax=Komagataeibacter sp. FNDCF1 TaxID=2878681 RepID=UPI001E2D636A|nr:HWE histidine kinase domain-containing protein [Komagataeibacter sp. FNDCF1]MCE2564063.1 response regulator [Komagataeibacter sp. FNDCF1]
MLGEFLALQIIALVRTRRLGLLHGAHGFLSGFLRDAPRVSDIFGYFRDRTSELLDIIECDGGGVWIDGSWTARGESLPPADLACMLRVADARADGQIWHTDHLAHDCPGLGADVHGIAGAMVMPIWPARRDYLILFRRELVRTVMWGGDPEKTYPSGRLGARLTPRSSFDIWKQDVHGRSAAWTADDVELATQMRATLLEVMAAAHQQKLREQEQAEATQRMLNDELNHRVKNILAVMQALVTRAPAEDDSMASYSAALRGRIRALSNAHDQALRVDHGATLQELLMGELAPYDSQPSRIMLEGPCLRFSTRALTFMALLFHELATNAAKYGALSVPTGGISVAWEWNGQDCHICWCERGGPMVNPPAKSGFGGLLIERAIVHDLKGRAERRFLPHGVVVDVTLPGSTVVDAPPVPKQKVQVTLPPGPEHDGGAPALAGRTVMVLEDEFLVALDIEDMLRAHGVAQVCLAASIEEAFAVLEMHGVDAALLDVNVAGETSAPVARVLQARGTPFVFATGYGDQAPLAAEFPQARYLEKPVAPRDLLRMLSGLFGHAPADGPP